MIDCGISEKKMKDDLYKVDTLLITHSHSDHVKEGTLAAIRKEFPRIKVYGNADVAYQYHVDAVLGTKPIKLSKGRIIHPIEGFHDVPVTGFVIEMNGQKIFYMTDTNEVRLRSMSLDYIFLEANYDEQKLAALAKDYRRRGYDPTANAHRHLSVQQCRAFYYMYRKDKDTPLIELHKSSRFY